MASCFDFSAHDILLIPGMTTEKLAEVFPKEFGHLAGNSTLGTRLQIEGMLLYLSKKGNKISLNSAHRCG